MKAGYAICWFLHNLKNLEISKPYKYINDIIDIINLKTTFTDQISNSNIHCYSFLLQ